MVQVNARVISGQTKSLGEFGCVGQQHALKLKFLPQYIDLTEAFCGQHLSKACAVCFKQNALSYTKVLRRHRE